MSELDRINEYPRVLREFATYKLTIQGRSKKTVSEYLLDLRTFVRYIVVTRSGERPTDENMHGASLAAVDADFFESISTLEVYEFLAYASNERGNEARSRSRKLSAIKGLYKFLTVKQHYFDTNPVINIESPKAKKSLPKYLEIEESMDLLDAVRSDTESKTRLRDYAMITLFLNCGMRLSELTGISLGDIEADFRSLRVIGKGSKERVIYLNDACRDAIKTYLPERAAVAGRAPKQDNALFLSSRGCRISQKTVQWIVYKYLDAAGLEYKHFSTHKLRHTAATLMYQTGEVDIRVLKDILGHEQLTTTQIYTHVSSESMEAAMRKNPLSGVRGAKPNKLKQLDSGEAEEEPSDTEDDR